MRKTSLYLDESDAERLALLAESEGISQAEVLRRAIRSYLPQQRASRTFALDGAGSGPGGSIAELDEDELLSGFGE